MRLREATFQRKECRVALMSSEKLPFGFAEIVKEFQAARLISLWKSYSDFDETVQRDALT